MPTYEYMCDRGHEFTVEQAITDAPLDYCDEPEDGCAEGCCPGRCNASVRRLIPLTGGFRLKGGGWTGPGRTTVRA